MNDRRDETKIKVLHVLGTLNCGGVEMLIMNIYKHINRDKIDFDFVVHTKEKCYFAEEIASKGGHIYPAPGLNKKNLFQYIGWWKDFLAGHKYDVIHVHMISTALFYIDIVKKYDVRIILHSHSTFYRGTPLQQTIKKWLVQLVRKKADYYFSCSKLAGINYFGKDIINKANYHTLKNGIEVNAYRINENDRVMVRKKLGIKNSDFLIGHVGSFTQPKNHTFLLDVFCKINELNPNSKLILVGDGRLKNETKKKAYNLQLEDKVIFAGMRSDVNKLLMAMDVFLFPSIFEGLGMALIEAQATGLRCIASDNVPKESDITGLVKFLSLDAGADKWAECSLKAAESYTREDQSGKVRDAGYDIEDTVKGLEEFYEDCLDRKNRSISAKWQE